MSLLDPSRLIDAFLLGAGAVMAIKAISFFRSLWLAKRRVEVQEIDLQLKAVKDNHDRIATDDLIKRANDRNDSKDPKGES